MSESAKCTAEADATPATENRTYYTPQTLAQMWLCSTDAIYDLLKRGHLKGFKIGSSWRITESAVLEYEQNHENQVAQVSTPRDAYTGHTEPGKYRVV